MNEAQIERYMETFQEKLKAANAQAETGRAAGLVPDAAHLVFALAGVEYAVPMTAVRATVAVPRCVPVPLAPPHHLGVANVRGAIVSVVDLCARLGHEAVDSPERALVVLEQGSHRIGFVVDSVNRVLTVKSAEELAPVTPLEVARLLGAEPAAERGEAP